MEYVEVAVIGGGPAGLRAAEVAAEAGRKVVIFDAKPSMGRKFLVAGRGGLNITHGEDLGKFRARYAGGGDWEGMLDVFSPEAMREWCGNLGQETFQASSGRVYPKALKGAPMLRAWLGRLGELGVELRPRTKLVNFTAERVLVFEDGVRVRVGAAIFALGGGSWPRTGSDGGWLRFFKENGVGCAPLVSSNCGWEVDWPEEILALEGQPLKNIEVSAAGVRVAGELLITRYGLEGGAIYGLGNVLRAFDKPEIEIDFKPSSTLEQLVNKLGKTPEKDWEQVCRRLKIKGVARSLLFHRSYSQTMDLLRDVKNFRLKLERPRPIEEAISSAGGVSWDEVDAGLMLKRFPGFFVSGEMLDWDAPTGGYLLQGAFATGSLAGAGAAKWLEGG